MPQQRTEAPASTAAKRCVIYCRKSSSEGLDRNYTSIDAQRDTCLRFSPKQHYMFFRGPR